MPCPAIPAVPSGQFAPGPTTFAGASEHFGLPTDFVGGDPTPSPDDLHLTAEALAAGRLLDINVLDHLVIGHDAWVSLRDRGIAFDRPGTPPGRAA
ncbi:MAG: JAB domain-containing protein [Chloroflexota bacterium]